METSEIVMANKTSCGDMTDHMASAIFCGIEDKLLTTTTLTVISFLANIVLSSLLLVELLLKMPGSMMVMAFIIT